MLLKKWMGTVSLALVILTRRECTILFRKESDRSQSIEMCSLNIPGNTRHLSAMASVLFDL